MTRVHRKSGGAADFGATSAIEPQIVE